MNPDRYSIVLAACLLLAWSSPTMGEGGAAADHPLNLGSRWEYVDEDGGREVVSVTGSVVVRGITLTQVTRDSDPPFFLLRCRDGVLRFDALPGHENPTAQACLILKEPLDVGQEWTCALTDPPLAFTVLSKETIVVPAGRFESTFRIGYRPAANPIYEGFVWFVPSVGFVAMEGDEGRSELARYGASDLLGPPGAEGSAAEVVSRLGFPSPAAPPHAPGRETGPGDTVASRLPPVLLGLVVVLAVVLFFWRLDRQSSQIDLDDLPEVQRGQVSLAAAMVQEGLYGDAAAILERLAAKNPRWPDLAAGLGRAYLFQGRLGEAVVELKRALNLNPQLSAVRLDLARALLKTGDTRGALDQVEAALSVNAGWADAHHMRGQILAAQGEGSEAARSYAQALRINPAFSEARAALASLGDERTRV